MTASKQVDYRELSHELETIVADLQRDDLDIDVALKQYQRGLEVVKQLETYLKTAENTITKLKA